MELLTRTILRSALLPQRRTVMTCPEFTRSIRPFLHPLLRYLARSLYLKHQPRLHAAALQLEDWSDRFVRSLRYAYLYDKLRISMKLDRFIAALLPSFSSRSCFSFFPSAVVHQILLSLKPFSSFKRHVSPHLS